MTTPLLQVHDVLLIIAVILFVVAAIPLPSRINIMAVGLAVFALAHLV